MFPGYKKTKLLKIFFITSRDKTNDDLVSDIFATSYQKYNEDTHAYELQSELLGCIKNIDHLDKINKHENDLTVMNFGLHHIDFCRPFGFKEPKLHSNENYAYDHLNLFLDYPKYMFFDIRNSSGGAPEAMIHQSISDIPGNVECIIVKPDRQWYESENNLTIPKNIGDFKLAGVITTIQPGPGDNHSGHSATISFLDNNFLFIDDNRVLLINNDANTVEYDGKQYNFTGDDFLQSNLYNVGLLLYKRK